MFPALLEDSTGPYLCKKKLKFSNITEISILSHFNIFRYSLELVSHFHRVMTTPYGHAVFGGRGGDGRSTMASVAALMTGHLFFAVPISRGTAWMLLA
jgi:hypothetical protein